MVPYYTAVSIRVAKYTRFVLIDKFVQGVQNLLMCMELILNQEKYKENVTNPLSVVLPAAV
jgi:hypothetical protein